MKASEGGPNLVWKLNEDFPRKTIERWGGELSRQK